MSKTVKDKIKGAALPERTILLCLRGDLDSQDRDLAKHASEVKLKGATSLEGSGVDALASQLDALRQQMTDESIELKLRAMTKRRWDELVAAHPNNQSWL